MDPFLLTGPQFLVFYLGLVAVVILALEGGIGARVPGTGADLAAIQRCPGLHNQAVHEGEAAREGGPGT